MKRIVCIQTSLTQHDYRSEKVFYERIKHHLLEAQQHGLLTAESVVCLPEYVGTWLIFLNARAFVWRAQSFAAACRRLVLANWRNVFRYFIRSQAPSRISDALFRSQAEMIARTYEDTFSLLAQEFNVTLIAGTVVLPHPSVVEGRLKIDLQGPLHNVCGIWNAQGTLQQLIIKSSPTAPEQQFTSGGSLEAQNPVESPAGRLGILICGDGWVQETYEHLASRGVDAFIVLAFVPSDVAWNEAWKGYSGRALETDVDRSDIGKLTEYEAWKKYCLCRAARFQKPSLVFFNRTQLWDFGSHGHPMRLTPSKIEEYTTQKNGRAIIIF